MRKLGPELLRFFSVLVIVWFHGHGFFGDKFVTPALACLLLFSVLLPLMGKSVSLGWGTFVKHRAARLLVPYVVFWCFYGLLSVVSGGGLFPSSWIILSGHGPHLWYLPFSFFSSLLGYQLDSRLLSYNTITAVGILLGVTLVFLLLPKLWTNVEFVKPIGHYFAFSPAVPLGVLIKKVLDLKDQRAMFFILAGVPFVLIGSFLVVYGFLSDGVADDFGIAFLFVSAALLWKHEASERMLTVTSGAMAVYLLHPAIGFVLIRLGIPALDYHGGNWLAFTMIAISIPVALFVRKTRLRVVL